MKKPKLTRAEQLARHRKIFLLARDRRVTLIEAEQLLAREEWAAQQERLKAVRECGRQIGGFGRAVAASLPEHMRPAPEDAPWMMRD